MNTVAKPIPGVHLVKVLDDPAEDKMADDVVDLVREIQRGAQTDYQSQADAESERRGEIEFWRHVARVIDERCPWADGKVRVTELGTRKGWHIQARDRYGRTFPIEVTYDELAEVALMQQAHDQENGPLVMADKIVDKIEQARKRYFERAGLA